MGKEEYKAQKRYAKTCTIAKWKKHKQLHGITRDKMCSENEDTNQKDGEKLYTDYRN